MSLTGLIRLPRSTTRTSAPARRSVCRGISICGHGRWQLHVSTRRRRRLRRHHGASVDGVGCRGQQGLRRHDHGDGHALSDDRVAGDVFTASYTGAAFDRQNVGTGKRSPSAGSRSAGRTRQLHVQHDGIDDGGYHRAGVDRVGRRGQQGLRRDHHRDGRRCQRRPRRAATCSATATPARVRRQERRHGQAGGV